MEVYGESRSSDSGCFSQRLGPRQTEPGNFNLRMYEKKTNKKKNNGQTKQTFAVEAPTDAAISEATCSHGFNVRHYFLIKLN